MTATAITITLSPQLVELIDSYDPTVVSQLQSDRANEIATILFGMVEEHRERLLTADLSGMAPVYGTCDRPWGAHTGLHLRDDPASAVFCRNWTPS